ncbi:hypothetical protein N5J48_04355 [Acinetobacter ursingii]|uniref:hypothetical protein n=1 Tax=Acinetobacter ursingii TaxID=108980 RepID=UPI00124EAEFA|nr:hypothetical protein [Acinetobacter ursingii]MDG9859404.1 hypothetical protein [Acinetobacter ursingii]MDG9894910.1 hypothetical protein [Acinetobacter ursingii]MDH0006602.1 hypothetical protein [Acinetobacter ursingii]MDH0478411.1 hypothetical protein [Acinetobacter ursingii]MDH2118972.1 hypothetical protein [Acinetobacter ursingii]
MDKEIKQNILIELTKAKVSRWDEDQKGISTQAIWWVQAYHDSVKELNEAIKTYKKDNGIEMNITPEMLSELDSGLR